MVVVGDSRNPRQGQSGYHSALVPRVVDQINSGEKGQCFREGMATHTVVVLQWFPRGTLICFSGASRL